MKEEAKADSDVRQKAPANTCFGKASHQLAALIAKTAKLASKGKLDPTCQAAIEARATRPLAIVTALAGGQ